MARQSRSSLSVAVILGLVMAMSHVGEYGLSLVLPLPLPTPQNTPASTLQVGFYVGKCNYTEFDVQKFIEDEVIRHFNDDKTLLPALLRMQFHDCMINGCDASLLIKGDTTERAAGPNRSVRGFEIIDAIKEAVELNCPGIVSCADILAICVQRLLQEGGLPKYNVQTGRRDGLVSNKGGVNLPGSSMDVPTSYGFFQPMGFSMEEMVLLIGGGHTVGKSQCRFFQDRLNSSSSAYDSDMDADLRKTLTALCQVGGSTAKADLDQSGIVPDTVDNAFFKQIWINRGLLPIDQELARNANTKLDVFKYSQASALFGAKFGDVMVKLQAFGVKTGTDGNIRKVCTKFNS